jgi:hypothetical protein
MAGPIYRGIPGVEYRFVLDHDRGELRWEVLDGSVIAETRILRTAELVHLSELIDLLRELQRGMYERRRFDRVPLKKPGGHDGSC